MGKKTANWIWLVRSEAGHRQRCTDAKGSKRWKSGRACGCHLEHVPTLVTLSLLHPLRQCGQRQRRPWPRVRHTHTHTSMTTDVPRPSSPDIELGTHRSHPGLLTGSTMFAAIIYFSSSDMSSRSSLSSVFPPRPEFSFTNLLLLRPRSPTCSASINSLASPIPPASDHARD